jgi:hypothetical protein
MPAKDISSDSSCMERGSGILYKVLKPVGTDPASYGGVLKLPNGEIYWAYIWPRLVRGKPVVELRLTPKI